MCRVARWGAGLLVVLVSLVGPARAEEPDLLDRLVRDLGGKDSTRRVAALNRLRNGKDERVIPRLLEAMGEFELFGRFYAVLVIESFPEKTVQATHRRLLRRDDPYLRLCAAAWFLRQGDDAHVGRIVEALGAEGVDLSTRQYMVNRLTSLDDARVREALHGLLTSDAPATLVGSVLMAVQHPEKEASKTAVRKFLVESEPGPDLRLLAAGFLYRFGEEALKADIAQAMRTGKTTSIAISRLRSFLSSAGHAATDILDAATELLDREENAFVLRTIVQMLTEFRHRKALPRIRKFVSHEDARLAKAAFEAVMLLGGNVEKQTLQDLLQAENAGRRLAAADLLRRMDDPSGLPVVAEILRTGSATERRDAVTSLADFRRRDAVDPVIEAMLDESSLVRSQALFGLNRLLGALFPYRRLDFVATGYSATAPDAQRRAAVEKIRAWWKAHRDGNW